EKKEDSKDVNQNPVHSLLAGLAASSRAANNNQSENRRKPESHLLDTSADVLEASVDLMEKSADLLEASAAELYRKRSRDAESSSMEMLDRSEEILEQSAAELQRKKRRLELSAEDLDASMESKRRNRSLPLDHSSVEIDDLPRPDEATMSNYPASPEPHSTLRREDASRASPSPARQETYGRSSAFYGLGSLDDLPEPPPHLQSPPLSGGEEIQPAGDPDSLPDPPSSLLARTLLDDVHRPLRIEPNVQPVVHSTKSELLQPQPLHALQLFSPSSDISPESSAAELPPEPSTPVPLNTNVVSAPPSLPTASEYYDVLERSSRAPCERGRCPSYEESTLQQQRPKPDLLALVLERRGKAPMQQQSHS
ncbi:hypothetical protein PFISCL1PPCAC_16816, partial [Pristionchus fissidentatus]